ncbi:MAG: hypothetical protein ACYTHJ_06520 [Planctomycetota bacterium]|jgi:hypothetical protein
MDQQPPRKRKSFWRSDKGAVIILIGFFTLLTIIKTLLREWIKK